MKLLAVGDIHLGRRPSRLPADIALPADSLGPAEAWRRTVDTAVGQRVDAVLLAGDVVDRDDDFFEGYRELHSGVRRLREAGIEVVAVAGNHDVKVLPRLAAELPGFRLVGAGGQWESVSLGEGADSVHVWGWSFTSPKVLTSPVVPGCIEPLTGLNIGLLHCDLDAVGSPYAPVRRSDLEAVPLDAWLLGHIHKPSQLSKERLTGYLGSLSGTDPGEPGAHGPWLLTTSGATVVDMHQLPVAPLRWEPLELDLTQTQSPEDVQQLLIEMIKNLHAVLPEVDVEAVGLRVTLSGRTAHGSAAGDILRNAVGESVAQLDSVQYFVEKVLVRTRPNLDLVELAKRSDPAGILAEHMLLLDRVPDDAGRRRLVAEARRGLDRVGSEARFSQLSAGSLTDEEIVLLLQSAGMRLLERMDLQLGVEAT